VILGHYAVALAAKRAAPDTSLGTLVLAAQWLDHIWPVFLLAVAGWALLLGAVYFAARRNRAAAWVVGAAVASHWFLDVPMHTPDLPLWPGASPKVGGGLWNWIPATIAVELGLFAAGLAIYLRTTRAVDRIGSWGLGVMAALLGLVFVSGFFSPPPADVTSLAFGALGLWLFVGLGYWVDRHRVLRAATEEVPASSHVALA
jgi:hypothetical protein